MDNPDQDAMSDNRALAKERLTKASIGHIVVVVLTGVVCFLAIVQTIFEGVVSSRSASFDY